MDRTELREYNKRYLELSEKQYVRWEELNQDLSLLPEGFWKPFRQLTSEIGFSGDVLTVAIANWIKQENMEQADG